jgi:hypothetical protein
VTSIIIANVAVTVPQMLPQPWRALTPRRDLNPAASEAACQELNTAKALEVAKKGGGPAAAADYNHRRPQSCTVVEYKSRKK